MSLPVEVRCFLSPDSNSCRTWPKIGHTFLSFCSERCSNMCLHFNPQQTANVWHLESHLLTFFGDECNEWRDTQVSICLTMGMGLPCNMYQITVLCTPLILQVPNFVPPDSSSCGTWLKTGRKCLCLCSERCANMCLHFACEPSTLALWNMQNLND